MNSRAESPELDTSTASAALIALVRLIAHQAAREWAEQRPEESQPSALTLPEKSR
jgi:hypothetical protein